MNFQDNLSAMPDISHLSGLDVLDAQGKVLHHIPAVQGKLGSLKLYNALAQEFGNRLDSAAAERGLDADILQSLAYRLYSLAEKHGWTEAGLLFNALGGSWPEIAAAARTAASTGPDIQTALDLDTLENH